MDEKGASVDVHYHRVIFGRRPALEEVKKELAAIAGVEVSGRAEVDQDDHDDGMAGRGRLTVVLPAIRSVGAVPFA
jgi:hypothetical protein